MRQFKVIRIGSKEIEIPSNVEIQVYSVSRFESFFETEYGHDIKTPMQKLGIRYEVLHDPRIESAIFDEEDSASEGSEENEGTEIDLDGVDIPSTSKRGRKQNKQ